MEAEMRAELLAVGIAPERVERAIWNAAAFLRAAEGDTRAIGAWTLGNPDAGVYFTSAECQALDALL